MVTFCRERERNQVFLLQRYKHAVEKPESAAMGEQLNFIERNLLVNNETITLNKKADSA